jgi:hypothetical protein
MKSLISPHGGARLGISPRRAFAEDATIALVSQTVLTVDDSPGLSQDGSAGAGDESCDGCR